MKKSLIILFAASLVTSCAVNLGYEGKTFKKSYESITAQDLKKHLYIIASDDMEGRMTGSEGLRKAAKYITDEYRKYGISHPKSMNSFYQTIPGSYFGTRRGNSFPDSDNILGYIEGTEKPNELIVISAHYDHVGKNKEGEIYNGADDNGSGTVALLELAEAFQKAKKAGKAPKRSVLILHVTAEEIGLQGSRYYADNPVFPLENTVVNLNIDMIGRSDPDNEGKNYVYVIGSDMLSSDLKKISENANNKTTKLELNYKYDDPNDPMRLYYRSDHYSFAKKNVPAAFYFDGIHADYHKTTDTAEKIDYELMKKRTQLIFATAWELANREERIVVDGKNAR